MDTIEHLTFIEIIAGGLPIQYWLALFFFFCGGASIHQVRKVRKGISNKPSSPTKFSVKHYITDPRNYLDFGIAIFSAYFLLWGADFLLGQSIVSNIQLGCVFSLGLGFGWQTLADKLMDLLKENGYGI